MNKKYVLSYHSIGNHYFSTRKSNFEKHLLICKKTFSTDFISNFNKPKSKFYITLDDGYIDNYTVAFPLVKSIKQKLNIYISTKYIGKKFNFSRNKGSYEVINSDMIREMSNSGFVEFGSHCHNHLDLSKLSYINLQYEIEKSVDILEQILNKKIFSFAFPFFRINKKADDILNKIGIKFVLCGPNLNFSNNQLYYIPRIPVKNKFPYKNLFF
jgi:peptidoglycan/xylan/chitin deacetylase (PgdA/CDA1 family)